MMGVNGQSKRLRLGKGASWVVWAVIAAALSVIAGNPEAENRSKARYYYAAGGLAQASGNEAAAYEYYKHAHRIDPTYVEAASAYGSRRLGIPLDTLQTETETSRSLGLMCGYVEAYPADAYEAQAYAYVAAQLGREQEAVKVLERAYNFNPSNQSLLVQLSETHAQAQDLKGAVAALDRYERLSGMQPQVTMRKVSYMLADHDTVGALREADRLIGSDPKQASYFVLKGNLYSILALPDSAFAYFKRAERVDPESGMAKLALADTYRQRGDTAAYDNKMYEVLLTEDLDTDQKAELLAHYLQSLMTSGTPDTKRGDYLFSVLEVQSPHNPRVLDLAARYLAAKGEMEEAVEKISYALDQEPGNPVFWSQLMLYQASAGKQDDALQTYDRAALHVTPDDNMRFYYANIAVSAKRYDLALEVYSDMVHEIDPDLRTDTVLSVADLKPTISLQQLERLSRLFATIGDVRHEAADTSGAYTAYENAITFDGSNALALNNYAYFLSIDGGDLDKALAMSEKANNETGSSNPTYLDTHAWVLHLKGNDAEAERIQGEAVKAMERSGEKSAEIYDHLGDIMHALGRNEEALEAWRNARTVYEEHEAGEEPEYKELLKKIAKSTNK